MLTAEGIPEDFRISKTLLFLHETWDPICSDTFIVQKSRHRKMDGSIIT